MATIVLTINFLMALLSILVGVLILLVPKALNYIVAVWLILNGLLLLLSGYYLI